MKKLLLLITVILIGISFYAQATVVSIENARLAGKNFYYERINRSGNVPYESIVIAQEFTETADNVPVYYIFNFKGTGFIIVSADDIAHPVLGYSFNTSLSPDNIPENFAGWMDHYRQQILDARQAGTRQTEETRSAWEHLLTDNPAGLTIQKGVLDVEPLLYSTWNQDFPYNDLCPADPASPGGYNGHVPVGCTATAMAQIMYYWRYPTQGSGYHCIFPSPPEYGPQCADFANTTYDWNGMSNHPTKECYPAALISYHAGVSCDMDYSPDGSSASLTKAASGLRTYLNYSNTTQKVDKSSYSTNDWNDLLKGDLDAGMPMEYAGYPQSGAGHAWVCDGYQGTDYFHFNLGWGGSYDGYYYLNNITPGPYNFSYGQQAIVHIEPITTNYPYYCSGQTNLFTYDFGSIEDGSGPVLDYQNNAACSWLIAPDDSVQTITLTFSRFDTDASDLVTVYDGETAAAPVLGTFSGSSLPAPVTSTGNKMLVTFSSNGSGTAQGWMANYSTTLFPFCAASTTLNDPSGDISDGSGRFDYRNDVSCKWYLKPTGAATVTLTFTSFDTEQDKDFVKMFDLVGGTQLGVFSGNSIPPPVTSPSGQMMVLFTSNKTVRGIGWDASYSITVGTEDKEVFENLAVYPNPAGDFLTIRFTFAEMQSLRIELVSLSGQTLYREQPENVKGSFEKKLDVSPFSRGVYLLRLTSDRGITTQKIVLE